MKSNYWLPVKTISWLILVFLGQKNEAISQVADSTDTVRIENLLVSDVQTIANHRPAKSAVVGDNISLTITNLRQYLNDSVLMKGPVKMELVINGVPCSDIVSSNLNIEKETITFFLDSASSSIKMLRERLVSQWDKSVTCSLSVLLHGKILKNKVHKFEIYFTTPRFLLHCVLLFFCIIIILYLLAVFTNIMRVGSTKSTFSLAQSQLTFWTVVVALSVIYIWILTGTLPDLTPSVLALLGISVATTAGGKFVSINMRGDKPFQEQPSKGFFQDILSDDKSTNIQRFQMVIWTFILGIIFISKVLTKRQIFDFNESYLVLTGISSGAYVLLKYSENKESVPAQNPGPDNNNTNPIPPMG